MRIRFKLRTLLIATALVGLILGLQIHVHMKAVRFVEEMGNPSKENQLRLMADANVPDGERFAYISIRHDIARVSPLSLSDVLLFRRRCEVSFVGSRLTFERQYAWNITYYSSTYRFHCFGVNFDSESSSTRPDIPDDGLLKVL